MKIQWEYCMLITVSTNSNNQVAISFLKPQGEPEGKILETTMGNAIAQLGVDGWEMCGYDNVFLGETKNAQAYFKRAKRNV